MSYYGYQTFRYDASYGEVIIMIRPKKGLVRMYDAGNEGDALLRNLLREKEWQITSVALSAPPTDQTYAKNVYLIRGENLLNYLKEPGSHNDSVLDLLVKSEQESIQRQRAEHAAVERDEAPLRMVQNKVIGAGILPYCISTGRFLFGVRGQKVPGAGLVALFGGKGQPGETPQEIACREFREEAGIDIPPSKLAPLWLYEDKELVYHNFLLPVSTEFEPDVDPEEVAGHMWLTYREFAQTRMHPGVLNLFENDPTLQRIVTTGNRPVPKFTQIVDALMGSVYAKGTQSGDDPDDDEPPPRRAA